MTCVPLLACSALACAVAVAPAHAEPYNPAPPTFVFVADDANRCGLVSTLDLTVDGSYPETGVLFSGPVATDVPGGSISVTCAIQTTDSRHLGDDDVAITSNPQTQVAVLAAHQVSYEMPSHALVHVCTSVVVNGTTYYWDTIGAAWSTSSAVSCDTAIFAYAPGLLEPFTGVLTVADPVLCPTLRGFFPPEGDAYPLWNCPPA